MAHKPQNACIISAPSSIMLFGEHSVLRHGLAIACALEKRLFVTLTPRDDNLFVIESSLSTQTTSIQDISLQKPLHFIEEVLKHCRPYTQGACITISSSIDPTVGLASSSAVTVATLAAIKLWKEGHFDKKDLLKESIQIIKKVQGCGSGTDAAASIYGGVISFDTASQTVTPLAKTLPLVLIYSGSKTKTPEVIRYVEKREKDFPSVFYHIFQALHETTKEATLTIPKGDLIKLGSLMNISHNLMNALGVGTKALQDIQEALIKEPSIYGAKISGSGLGDAVVGLGTISSTYEHTLPSTVSEEGVRIE